MNKFVITIARETGSGGHNITKKLSEALGVPYYDRDLLRKASEVSGIHERLFGEADERIGFKEMISAAEKVYTGEVLPPDSDDYLSTRNLFRTGELHHPRPLRELPPAGTSGCAAGVHPRPAGGQKGPGGRIFARLERERDSAPYPCGGQAACRLLSLLYRRGLERRRGL